MGEKIIQDTLSELVETKDEADALIAQLEQVGDALYSQNVSLEVIADHILLPSKKERLLTLMKQQAWNTKEKKEILTFLELLQSSIRNLPLLRLTLSYEPEQKTIQGIREWCYKTLGIIPLLEIAIDPRIIGGCLLTVEGMYKDYSVKKAFVEKQQYLLDAFFHHA